LLFTFPLVGDEPWNRFRGPNGSGISTVRGLPAQWSDKDYRWSVDLPGTGNSSPVVWGDHVYVTAANEEKLERALLCYAAADGKLLWSHAVPFEAEKKHRQNSYATSTPTADAERVYTFWQSRGASQLQAFTHDGRPAWTLDLGSYKSGHGGGISPVVVDGVVVLNLNHEGQSRLVGVDAATGKQKWQVPRDSIRATYSTPCTFEADGKRLLAFTSWRHGFTAVEPQSGAVVWELPDVFDPKDEEDKRSIGSPFYAEGRLYGTCGFTGGKKYLACVNVAAKDSSGAQTPTVAFRLERNVNHMPTALVYNGLLFIWSDGGILVCAKADTGKTVWTERIGGNFACSPVCIDGRLYAVSEGGEAVVVAAAEKFAELGRSTLPEGTSATPAVGEGALYLRTYGKLMALPAAK
jgi:outer membrane protein assembly factor BamB